MSLGTCDQQKVQIEEKENDSVDAEKSVLNDLNIFTQQHSKESAQLMEQQKQISEAYEKLEISKAFKNLETAELQELIEKIENSKSLVLKNYTNLQNHAKNLTVDLANEQKKRAEIQIQYEATVSQLTQKVKKAQQQIALFSLAKNKAWAKHHKAIKEKIRKTNDRAEHLELEKNQYAEKIKDLEVKIEENLRKIESGESTIEQKELTFPKKDEKLRKEAKRLRKFKKQLNQLKVENKSLEKQSMLQDRKMSKLQNDLNCQIRQVSPKQKEIKITSELSQSSDSASSAISVLVTQVENMETTNSQNSQLIFPPTYSENDNDANEIADNSASQINQTSNTQLPLRAYLSNYKRPHNRTLSNDLE